MKKYEMIFHYKRKYRKLRYFNVSSTDMCFLRCGKLLIILLQFQSYLDKIYTLCPSFSTERRCSRLEGIFLQILTAVLGRVAGHYLCKLLDRIIERIRKNR